MESDNNNEIVEKLLNVDQITPEYIQRLELLNNLLENRVASNAAIINTLKVKYNEFQKLKESQSTSTVF